MASTNTSDHTDTSEDLDENPSSVVSPYSTEELNELVKSLQIENAEFRHQLRKFTSGMSPSTSTNTSTLASTHSNPLQCHADEFDQLGRSFCVLYEIWPRPAHLSQPFPESLRSIGPWHAQRYSNEQTKRDAIIAEVYTFVPLRFHRSLEASPFFATKFLDGAESMRSYFISNIRRHARDIFPVSVGPGVFAKGHKRSEVPAIMDLLRNPKKPGEHYPRYPSVLYKDGVIIGNNIFRSSTVVNILKAIFLGPTSVTCAPGTARSGPKPLAARLELKSLTAGSVALAAVLARFILSDDLLFQEVGAETHIKYHEDFNHYKQFMLVNFESPGMTATFKQLNWEVLGISSSPADFTGDDDNADLHDNAEEDEMRAELWGESGNLDSAPPPSSSPGPDPASPPLPPSPCQAEPDVSPTTVVTPPSLRPAEPDVLPTTVVTQPEVVPQAKKTRPRKNGTSQVTVNILVEGEGNTAVAAKPNTRNRRARQ
ncbi:hypothetical protein BJ322DRAFT_1109114 [Thelephora terrestris]|uniref:Uncharacterized protein n=1 Tax=Thelephora terrestris TaxID=56493 RepID=A0A9P6HCU7_9AGAM|nr:hypothetical protein BJ322DRAFT_1109114 [Thelephora terrestris]